MHNRNISNNFQKKISIEYRIKRRLIYIYRKLSKLEPNLSISTGIKRIRRINLAFLFYFLYK
jgi:hypothetical protein